jgi:regulator of nucleoside diphosphate kinase
METIKMTELDYSGLNNVIERTKSKNEKRLNLPVLKNEISKAKVVNSTKIAEDFVTLNSLVEILDFDTNKKMELRLVYSKEANFKKGDASIFSPLGRALIGCKEGNIIYFNAPSGRKKIKLVRIIYQPGATDGFDA